MSDDKKTDNKISNALGVWQDVEIDAEPVKQLPATIDPKPEDDEAVLDSKAARENIYDLIRIGQGALDELAQIADQSQHPRAYEVLATLTKTLLDANKDLMNIHTQRKELKSKGNGREAVRTDKTVNNNLFVGSTNELQKMIKDMSNGD